jgi:hypothetical protein
MREGEKPECRSKQEAAEEERQEPKKHEDDIKIIAAMNRIADEQHAANDENTPKEKGKRCREIVTIVGLYLAAIIAIIAILTTHKDSSDQIGALSGRFFSRSIIMIWRGNGESGVKISKEPRWTIQLGG